MKTRTLGKTGIELPILSFGASSLGQEFRSVALDDALKSVQVALDCGLNFIDTSPFYGRGMSEVLLGIALRGVPRDSYKLCTKLGRYDLTHFDFSAKRVAESIDVSLHRLGTDHLDIVLCHDIEFVPMQQIVDETLPALRRARDAGRREHDREPDPRRKMTGSFRRLGRSVRGKSKRSGLITKSLLCPERREEVDHLFDKVIDPRSDLAHQGGITGIPGQTTDRPQSGDLVEVVADG